MRQVLNEKKIEQLKFHHILHVMLGYPLRCCGLVLLSAWQSGTAVTWMVRACLQKCSKSLCR